MKLQHTGSTFRHHEIHRGSNDCTVLYTIFDLLIISHMMQISSNVLISHRLFANETNISGSVDNTLYYTTARLPLDDL